MSSQDGPGAFLFAFQRPTARLSLPIPSSWRRPCNQRNPGLALSWWHSHMHVFETSHRRVFRWELCKRSLSIPTIFDSLMTRRGLGGCDPERDRGGEEGRGASHLGSCRQLLLAPATTVPALFTRRVFNLSSRFFQAFANPMSERGERDGRWVGFWGRQQVHQRGQPAVLFVAPCESLAGQTHISGSNPRWWQ